MGNRAARLATPCFASGGRSAVDAAGEDAGGGSVGVGQILSFDGYEAFDGATIHGVLLPSNQSTVGTASSSLSRSASSSCDSSSSFSFRTLQPGLFSGSLDYCASPSSSSSGPNSGVLSSAASRRGARTEEDIMADLYATRRRRRCQLELDEAASVSPLLDRLRRAVASALRVGRAAKKQPAVTTLATSTNGDGGAIRSKGVNGHAAEDKVQWARGKAGEDRVHVVVSEERGWMFVGIYDGFNGPDATDYLVANLYASVCRELPGDDHPPPEDAGHEQRRPPPSSCNGRDNADLRRRGRHGEVLDALARALRRTEEGYFAEAEARAAECPELAMMGSCVLVLLMKGADVYSMNVGDSRAVLAHRAEPDLTSVIMPPRHRHQHSADGHVTEEIRRQFDECDMTELVALQLTMEHSTTAYKEVRRIRSEHLDDPACILNGRVKGSLKVTRAFGAGYLKEPRWNKALLEVFRVDYVGALPYITCKPFLRHHCLGPRDKFLILASDGLYEYFTNEEVVGHVEAFTTRFPDEDPAKYLSHEILLRAARQAGMGFHELLEVRQGDRRQYHDDVSIIIISLEGKIWRSSA
ncbi:putative protein phosphatase 2C 46 [Hordeum vulgare subsp. vulgare]|uniref:protein-serine/threonine phosphatase n=1 Tax=Hordeum vulgare subsp. vulgare TaxID=112509 RepID=A0A8I6WPW0_HORVV|nr:putative protein phosphatase 2C 46 [Hordeum vulgare subsp. vulgare]